MLIRVKYQNNQYDMVRPELLDRLLEKGSVSEFMRHDGWVKSTAGSIRHTRRTGYYGPDRRKKNIEPAKSS